jgi:hexulose-6-phosphate isomerase
MKPSINAWAVEEKTGFDEMFRQIKEAGFEGIELNIDKEGSSAHSLTLETGSPDFEKIRSLSKQYGLPVVSISTSLYNGKAGSPPGADRLFAQKLLRKQLECAKELGAGGILAVPGGGTPEISIKESYDNSFAALSELREDIIKADINVGLENVWNGFFMSPFDMAGFIDKLDNPKIGAYYDVGNMIAFSWTEHWISILGKRIRNVHIKDFKRTAGLNMGGKFCDLLKGDVNWKAAIPALRGAGYDGYLTAEVFISDSDVKGISYTEFYKASCEAAKKLIQGAL